MSHNGSNQANVTVLQASTPTSSDILRKLQWKQMRHDEIYHSDICLLRIQARIAHHTLHLAKYSGKMVEALIAKGGVDTEALTKVVLDGIIIAMSSANTLSIPLWKIDGAEEDLSGALGGRQMHGMVDTHILGFTVLIGHMAKAVEALDHVEPLNSRLAYEVALKKIWLVLLKSWRILSSEKLEDALRKKMLMIEKRNPFYGRHPNYENDFKPTGHESGKI